MKTYLPELTVEVRGDLIRLEQVTDFEKACVVELHRVQVAQLVTLVGMAEPAGKPGRVKKAVAK